MQYKYLQILVRALLLYVFWCQSENELPAPNCPHNGCLGDSSIENKNNSAEKENCWSRKYSPDSFLLFCNLLCILNFVGLCFERTMSLDKNYSSRKKLDFIIKKMPWSGSGSLPPVLAFSYAGEPKLGYSNIQNQYFCSFWDDCAGQIKKGDRNCNRTGIAYKTLWQRIIDYCELLPAWDLFTI